MDLLDPDDPRPRAASRAELLDLAASGATVATGNARLARSLSEAYVRRLLDQGRTAWPTPSILPLTAWMSDCFEAASLAAPRVPPRLLTEDQERLLWAAVIREDVASRDATLLRVGAAARGASRSRDLLQDYRIDLDDRRFGFGESPEAFRRWARAFEARCAKRGVAAVSDLADLLASALQEGPCPLPRRLVLTGYYDLSPSLLDLAKRLGVAGCPVEWIEPAGRPGEASRLRAGDAREEILQAANWARETLERQPELRIGIVVPDLQNRRVAIEHALREALDPASLLPGDEASPRPWNLSLGRGLAEYPVVATALRLLELLRPPAEAEMLSLLLLSPHWACPPEPAERRATLARRALLDRRIRSLGDARLPLATLRFHAGGGSESAARPWHARRLARRLGAMLRSARELPIRAGAADWVAAFAQWLKAAGWAGAGPAGRPLDSGEYQAVEAWNELLSRFSALDDFSEPLGRDEALALLRQMAVETTFQPRSGEAAVQVLGLYEAIGQSFDRLWVMGLHDGAWPPAPGPDPFIPIGIQRERCLPHSGPDLELEWARRVTEQLRCAAPEVVFSYPASEGDQGLRPSPLIAGLPEREPGALPATCGGEWAGLVQRSAAAEAPAAAGAVPFAGGRVRGGSRLFADQAACPFKAFAAHRLGAEALDRPQTGLNAMRRGTLVHRLFAGLWSELGSQEKLLALDRDELRNRLRLRIADLLEAERRRSPATYTKRFRVVEAQRLESRAWAWLEIERQRSSFRVLSTELETEYESGGLTLRLFLDRVDELEDGSRAVLDYKTGKVTPSAWFGERPEEPQLPLYGVALRRKLTDEGDAAELAAIAFAQIHPDNTGFNGVVREPGLLPGLPGNRKGPVRDAAEHWPAVLGEWEEQLERLAAGFRAGTAEVDPKRGLTTCQRSYCALGPLCRVREVLQGGSEADDDASDGGADEL